MFPVIDLHCDTADRLAWQTLPAELKHAAGMDFYGPGDAADPDACRDLARNRCHVSLDAIEESKATPWAQCMACFVPDELSPEQAVRFYEHVAGHLSSELERNAGAAAEVRSGRKLRAALTGAPTSPTPSSSAPSSPAPRSRLLAIRTIENARMFAHDLGLVERYAHAGLAMASLSWNAAGPLASGHDSHEGLSQAGRAALRELERCGVIVDVSHLNDEGFADVAARTERPFVASHSNARAVCGHPRNLTDDQFRLIRDRGGLVGLNYCCGFIRDGAWDERAAEVTFDDVAAHIEHWLELDGEDVIALGSDFDGCDTPACISTAREMTGFQARLTERFGEGITRKLCYANALHFFEVWWR